jgi:hypothetical protein
MKCSKLCLFQIKANQTLLFQVLQKIQEKQILVIPDIRKIYAKQTLLVPYIRKIKAKQTLLIKNLKKIEVKRTWLISEIGRIDAKKKTGAKQSEQNLYKVRKDRENNEAYLKSIVETQHLKCRHTHVQRKPLESRHG